MRQSVVVRVFGPVIMQGTKKNWGKLLLCSLLAICLSSCKHMDTTAILTNKDTAAASSLTSPVSCSVFMFTNESHQYGLEEIFSNLLIKEIVYDGRLEVTSTQSLPEEHSSIEGLPLAERLSPPERLSPDLRIRGKILAYERSPVSYGECYINKYRLSMKVEIIILNCSNEVMEKKTFEDYMDFIPISSPLTAKGFVPREEDEVIQELCQRICCQAVSWMLLCNCSQTAAEVTENTEK
ncbi:MAG: LPS assembly lipoprotein LptE [bacterium]|nr:LPS assembly lipoprotein LptE [bacterium]